MAKLDSGTVIFASISIKPLIFISSNCKCNCDLLYSSLPKHLGFCCCFILFHVFVSLLFFVALKYLVLLTELSIKALAFISGLLMLVSRIVLVNFFAEVFLHGYLEMGN